MSIIDANAIVDFLASVIADRQRSAEDKDRAINALKFYAVKEDEANAETVKFESANDDAVQAGQPESSPETLEMTRRVLLDYGREGAKMLWYTPSDCMFSAFTDVNGTVRQRVTSKRFGGLRPDEFYENIPDSGPAPQFGTSRADDVIPDVPAFVQPTFGLPEFTPAVPLPQLPPTDTEILARKEAFASLDERYAPDAVAARVKIVEKEAAGLRARRNQTDGPTPVIAGPVIPPSEQEAKAAASVKIEISDAKIGSIVAAEKKPLSSVEQIEAQINAEHDLRDRYTAAQANLARLKALRQA